MYKFVAGLLGMFFLASSAFAQGLLGEEERTRVATPDRQYLAAMPGYTSADDERGATIDEGLHAVGIYGYQWDNNFGAEGTFTAEAIRGGGHRVTAMLDGYYAFGNRRQGAVAPYYLVGLGLAHNDINGETETSPAFNLGLGIAAPLDDLLGLRLRFRAEARMLQDTSRDGLNAFRVSVGLEVPLFQ